MGEGALCTNILASLFPVNIASTSQEEEEEPSPAVQLTALDNRGSQITEGLNLIFIQG